MKAYRSKNITYISLAVFLMVAGLFIASSAFAYVCSSDSDCGANGITGALFCQSNNVYQNYITYTCVNPGTASSYCTNSTAPQLQKTCDANQVCSNGCCKTSCTNHTYQKCVGPSLYWYDSCDHQQELAQYCQNGCSNNACLNNYCTNNAYEQCVGSSLYWYDSCGHQQSLVQFCQNGCSNGVCLNNNCTNHSYEQCVGPSLYWYDSCGHQQELAQYCQNGCYNNSCQNYVVTNYNYNYNYGTLNVAKTVKNLTSGTGFSTSTYASPSDTVMFMITVQAASQNAQNVFVRDTLPANLIYNNQLVVACSGGSGNCNNNYYNYSGNITSGINLGTVYVGQMITITYQVQVASAENFSYGTATLTNNVSVTGSQSGYTPTSNASVIVTRSTVLGASTVSTGLTNNFWVDSFFLPLLITLVVIWAWRGGLFFGVERWLDDKKKVRRGYKAGKELSTRIAKIKNLMDN